MTARRRDGRPLLAGLCSVTLRSEPLEGVVAAAERAGLQAVEWGGDVHVPPGDLAAAEKARRLSEDAGLVVVSYGSYLFADPGGDPATDPGALAAVLDTAEALGTSLVRVWCPFGDDANHDRRREVAAVLGRQARAAAARGIDLYVEFHGGTLTATADSTLDLLRRAGIRNLYTAWQPPYWAQRSAEDELHDIETLRPRLAHVHVYEWMADLTRRPLSEGRTRWPARLVAADDCPNRLTRAALLEFVAGDDPEQLVHDAATLTGWLAGLATPVVDDSLAP